MIIAKERFEQMINSPIRSIKGRVELYQGSTLVSICSYADKLINFRIDREGTQSKFFGFGICQKLTTTLLDTNRELSITNDNYLEVEFGVDNDYIYTFPCFYVDDVKRDETTNNITVTAYDALYKASSYHVSDLTLPTHYTIETFAYCCAALLKIPLKIDSKALSAFSTVYAEGANFEGTETIREALDAVAEATQTIYYINQNWELSFIRLDIEGEPVVTINKNKYFSLDSDSIYTLSTIVSTNELGNSVSSSIGDGATQYIRDNPFYELREDIANLVDTAIENVEGLSIQQFSCEWRGNFLIEIGDKLAFTTKDNKHIITYLLNDVVEYDGALSGKSQWIYQSSENETINNPSSLGEAIKQTYARVDKANKSIELVASETAAIKLTAEGIQSSISKLDNDISGLISEVSTKVSAEDVNLSISTALSEGVDKVMTTTGFTFNDEGLHINKSDSEITTSITENGMTVFKSNKAVLLADNQGVKAEDLHATTYLIIGDNSRFEDMNNYRTGCFWIGG